MTAEEGAGFALSCFKVKVSFIVAIKHSRCEREGRALQRRGRARSDKERDKELRVK